MNKEVVRKELRRVIDKIRENVKEDRMSIEVVIGDIESEDERDILMILSYLGYVVRAKNNLYKIDLTKNETGIVRLPDDYVELASEHVYVETIRRSSKKHMRELVNERMAYIEIEIKSHILADNHDNVVIDKVPYDDTLNDAVIKELEETGYDLISSSSHIVIKVEGLK